MLTIIIAGVFLRLAGIWRAEPIDYHCDDWVIARPVLELANTGHLEQMPHYKWSGCGLVYPMGYTLYALNRFCGPYDYHTVLVVGRIVSAVLSTLAVVMCFVLMRKLSTPFIALMAAALIAFAKLPVLQGHYATVTATVSLFVITIIWLCYGLFDLAEPKKSTALRIVRCIVLGAIIGWGIAAKWTILLAGIPLFVAIVQSALCARLGRSWGVFFKTTILRCVLIAVSAAGAFCIAMPDIFRHTDAVVEGLQFEIRHNQAGHLGEFTAENSTPVKRFVRTVNMLNRAGGVWLLIALGIALLMVPDPPEPSSFVSGRHSPVVAFCFMAQYRFIRTSSPGPFMLLCLLLADSLGVAIAGTVSDKRHNRRVMLIASFVLVLVVAMLYTLICISPFWKPESRLQCARWLAANLNDGDGVTATPMTPAWCIPGALVGRAELTGVRPVAAAGHTQYLMAAHRSLNVFKKHLPGKPVNPAEWFYGTPPDQRTLQLYAELNNPHTPYFTTVHDFFARPEFLGMDLRLFFQGPDQETTYANRGVTLFKVNLSP